MTKGNDNPLALLDRAVEIFETAEEGLNAIRKVGDKYVLGKVRVADDVFVYCKIPAKIFKEATDASTLLQDESISFLGWVSKLIDEQHVRELVAANTQLNKDISALQQDRNNTVQLVSSERQKRADQKKKLEADIADLKKEKDRLFNMLPKDKQDKYNAKECNLSLAEYKKMKEEQNARAKEKGK